MKKFAALTLTLCFAICTTVVAQDARMTPGMPSSKIKGMKTTKGAAQPKGIDNYEATECSGEDCPVMAKAMEALPKMVFRIGTEETCCHMTATKMAHENHEEILYRVGKKKFKDSHDAFEALVKQTELYVKRFVTPKVCEESGATMLAGEACPCGATSEKMTEQIVAATKDLKLTYQVGEKKFDKYNDAKRFARKHHQKGMYVVSGEKFENELEARLALAHKTYRSAVAAAQSVKTKAVSETDTNGSPEVASKGG